MEDPSARQPPAVRGRLPPELETQIEVWARAAVTGYGTEAGERAFTWVIETVYDVVFHRLLKKGAEAHVAEDILADATMNALKALDRYDPSRSFLAWFWIIARNLLISHWRAKHRSDVAGLVMEALDPARHSALTVEPEDVGTQLDYSKWLSRLPVLHQNFLNMLAEDTSVAEAAKRLGRSERWGFKLRRKLMAEVKQLLES